MLKPRFRTVERVAASLFAVTIAAAPCVAFAQSTPRTAPTGPTAAQPAASPESTSTVVEAQQRLTSGLALFREHDYRGAIHEFELANSAAPSADIWYNIARAHELLGELDAAADNYQRYLRDKVDPPDRRAVEALVRDLRHRSEIARNTQDAAIAPRILFEVQPAGASVYLNGALVGRAPIAGGRDVTSGTQDVRVTAPGMQEWRSSVRVQPSRRPTAAIIDLQPATQYRTVSSGHLASYILGGVGIAGLATGLALGIVAATHPACDGNLATGVLDDGCARAGFATGADAAYGVGAAFLLSAAIVYFVEAAASHTERVAPVRASR